jgi:hypothetical protein
MPTLGSGVVDGVLGGRVLVVVVILVTIYTQMRNKQPVMNRNFNEFDRLPFGV